MEQLIFLSEEHHAKISVSRGSALAWMEHVATYPWSFSALLIASAPAGSFGKMSPASCKMTEGGHLEPSWGRWQKSGMGSPTEFLTLNSSAFPNGASVCSLSDFLETGEKLERCFLSERRLASVVRHGIKRGRKLSTQLARALAKEA